MSSDQNPASDPKSDLIATVFDLQRQLSLTMQSTAIPRWMQLELTMAQFKALFVVAHRGPFTMNALADVLGVTQSTASHLVDRLEQVRLVERAADPNDRRRIIVQLATDGGELIETLQQGGHQYMRDLLARLEIADLAALVRGLSAILRVNQSSLPG